MVAHSVLSAADRQKLDASDDSFFYAQPRLVTHVDEGFIDQLTQLYRDRLPTGGCLLDLMSSWVSHLPADLSLGEVIGHGMNAQELRQNPRLDRFFVQDLNRDPHLPLEDRSVNAVTMAVSVQYLQQPEQVFQEIQRILRPGGVVIVSFSNRMFYQKAIAAWRDASDGEHIALVKSYFEAVPGFGPVAVIQKVNPMAPWLQMLGMGGGDPFYALIAHKLPLPG